MTDRRTVISHLQIIHVWAEYAIERDLNFLTEKYLKKIAQWTDDTLKLLNEHEEQRRNRDESLEKAQEEIKRLRGTLKEQEAVVRCKNCVKGSMVVQVGTLPYISCFGEDRPLDWFCADGRKKDD